MGNRKCKRAAIYFIGCSLIAGAFHSASAQDNGGGPSPQNSPRGQGAQASGGPSGAPNGGGGGGIARRLRAERQAIRQGVQNGTISPQQAMQLRQSVGSIVKQAAAERAQNGGQLNPNQIRQLKNELRQTKEQIQSATGAGTSQVQKFGPGDGLTGPKWTPGPDGAQNPAALNRGMKSEERRELRQERQATEQVQEQQQLDYEKQMTKKLGQQRNAILQDKKQIQKERTDYGAN